MPESRRRKRKHRSARRQHTSSGLSQRAKIIIMLVVAALVVAFVLSLILQSKKTTSGNEQTTASGLKYTDEVVGSGASVQLGQSVTVHYTGTLTDGTKFDSSLDRNQPLTFTIGAKNIISGWNEGIVGMKVGGKRKLIVPPNLGYGATGKPPQIPPNATLFFDIELLDVK